MRILGIDPGIGRTGWGIIDVHNSRFKVGEFGCIETSNELEFLDRLKILHETIDEILEKFQPETVAIEDLFFNTNAKTALTVGQARGVVLLSIANHNLPLSVYTPLQVKMALTGYGRAEKSQIGQMVKILLKLDAIPKPDDTADALAIALTHSFSHKLSSNGSNTLK